MSKTYIMDRMGCLHVWNKAVMILPAGKYNYRPAADEYHQFQADIEHVFESLSPMTIREIRSGFTVTIHDDHGANLVVASG